MLNTPKKKNTRIIIIVITAIVILATPILGYAYYYKSSTDYCRNYAEQNKHKTGLPESMDYNSLYDPCMKDKGLWIR